MNLGPVLDLLHERTGLLAAALGQSAVEAAVRGRLEQLGLDPNRYTDRARADAVEWQALIDAVVVPETWFFRGGQLFYYLAEQARAALRAQPESALYRALCVPCSTGEEPLSLVIALAGLGVPLARCPIEGVDVSAHAVALARRARYSEIAFRQTEPSLRERYFRPAPGGWQAGAELGDHVRYRVGNLLDLPALGLTTRYDLIFCRNVFIYLSAAARRRALRSVVGLLAPGGLLCLGHADPVEPEGEGLERVGPGGYFLLRKAVSRQLPAVTMPKVSGGAPPLVGQVSNLPFPIRPVGNLPHDDLLARARQCADAGRLGEALRLCRAAEARDGPTADICALIGIIHQARHRPDEAARSYQQALYLRPDHREALLHLMLLHQQAGRHEQAAALHGRLDRLGAEPEGPT